ncbi:DUF1330 domain-containing protein [Longimicrobium sp.]|uniref:DUF1330 domain-containing protein n=1 Tax=Longimicrobium sp. TaxID=2029185 RepID=UPI002C816BF6|nr:DUF1330 domain-containing protein [Longimicrobium sp.]HSU16111.1 DUF1330 domain-containing protein [Longimicrobium sp.]
MKHYAIVEMDVTDRGWIAAYVQDVTPMIERFGGRYLARTSRLEKMEGERAAPQVLVLTEWPSREAAMAFYESDEYRPYRESRLAGARCEFVLVPGEDITGAARIPE